MAQSQQIGLTNQFLIAMPALGDPNFAGTVSYVCEDNENGAIAIIINKPSDIKLAEIFAQMSIQTDDQAIADLPVLLGGPVHQERGFVLHTPAQDWESSLTTADDITVTTSQDILYALAKNEGPQTSLISLGYAGWGPGQLAREVAENCWLTAPANAEILFHMPFELRWEAAVRSLGVDPKHLSEVSGHA